MRARDRNRASPLCYITVVVVVVGVVVVVAADDDASSLVLVIQFVLVERWRCRSPLRRATPRRGALNLDLTSAQQPGGWG